MELSIIIVNLDAKDLISGCVESIGKESSNIKKEIIVVDNGSTDGSVEVLKDYEKNLENFKVIYNDGNFGYAKANNQGIKIAKGEYILLLNNDTIVKKGSLEKLLKFAQQKEDAGVIGPKLLNKDGSLQPSCFRFPTITNAIKEYWLGHRGLFEKYAPSEKGPSTVDAVVGAVFLITPKAFKKVGLLDERYFAYFEDISYCREVWKVGLKVYYYPDVETVHYHGATFKKMYKEDERWRKLIPGSKIYHGLIKHYLINTVIWTGQKWQKLFK